MDLMQGILTVYAVVLSSSLATAQLIYYPQFTTNSAFASSTSVPGYQPVAYTATSGAGQALASAGTTLSSGQYVQQVSETKTRRDVKRSDATQQRIQVNPPLGLFGFSHISPEHLVLPPAFHPSSDSPTSSSSFVASDKLGASAFAAAQPSQPKETTTFTESQASATADSFQGGSSFQSAPASAYGPPAKGSQNFAGSQAQAQASANQGEKAPVPAPVYGLPGFESGSFGTDGSSTNLVVKTPHKAYGVPDRGNLLSSSPEVEREFVFVPAFPSQERPGVAVGAELAPPSGGGFVPPDGALLSPPAPVVNNVPLPSPRFYSFD